MKMKITVLLLLLIIGLSFTGCIGEEKPEGILTVAELLDDLVYDTEVAVYGKIAGLSELACHVFNNVILEILTSTLL